MNMNLEYYVKNMVWTSTCNHSADLDFFYLGHGQYPEIGVLEIIKKLRLSNDLFG